MKGFAGLLALLALLAAGVVAGAIRGATPPIIVTESTTSLGTAPASTTTSTTSTSATSSTAASTTATTPSPFGQSVKAALSSGHAGMRPVTLTLTLGYEMQCGYPGTGPLVVELPATEQLPKSFTSASASLNGKAVRPSFTSGKALRVNLPPKPTLMCDVIGPGTLKLVLTRAANLGNPRKPGSYAVSAHVDGRSFRASLRITA